MKIKKVISVETMKNAPRGAELTSHLSGGERLSLLEELRRESARIFHYEYPRRLRRVLTVIDRNSG